MGTYRTILVALNACCGGSRAIEHAAGLAREHHARLIVLTVVPPPVLCGVGAAAAPPDQQPGFARELQRALALLPLDVGVEGCLMRGPVAQRIVETARTGSCDLIVLGCAGHSRVRRLLKRPVCDAVARHSRCPVLIVEHASATGADGV